jgi:hypothetical protein
MDRKQEEDVVYSALGLETVVGESDVVTRTDKCL